MTSARGVYADQPNPYGVGKPNVLWKAAKLFAAAAVTVLIAAIALSPQQQIFTEGYSFLARPGQEASFVTPEFDIPGHTSNVEVNINTSLNNNWMYFNFALINEQTGEAYDFGREVSYYHGVDSDGAWSEGDASEDVVIPAVPPGRSRRSGLPGWPHTSRRS